MPVVMQRGEVSKMGSVRFLLIFHRFATVLRLILATFDGQVITSGESEAIVFGAVLSY